MSGAAVVLERIGFAGQARVGRPRGHGRGNARPPSTGGEGGRRGREGLPRARACAAQSSAARVDEPPPGTQPHALSGDPGSGRGRPRRARRPASPRAARRRVDASPSSGASSTRASALLLDERPELPRRDAVALERRLGGDRRGAGTVVDQRDFAEVVAVRERVDVIALHADRRLALVDDEEADPGRAFARDRVARVELPLLHRARKTLDVLLVQVREQRDLPDEFLWGRHAEDSIQ